jgi:hypothetical protein
VLNLLATKYLVFGGSGRLGGLCAELLSEHGVTYGSLRRNGDLVFAETIIGNIHHRLPAPGRYLVIDASVDYASLQRLVVHEDAKFAFLQALNERGDLRGLLAFSSGVLEFDDVHIKTEWHRQYKQLKLRLETFVENLACPAYCPRLFVVIGPRSFAVTTTGWVDVVRQVCGGNRVGIATPSEPRSWVAEGYLRAQLARFFFEAPGESLPSTPLNGTFCLGDIARFVAEMLNRPVTMELRDVPGWLSVPYVSHVPPAIRSGYALEEVLAPLVAAHMARVDAGPISQSVPHE